MPIVNGSQKMNIMKSTIIVMIKGITPRTISINGTSASVEPLVANKTNPTGGVMVPM